MEQPQIVPELNPTPSPPEIQPMPPEKPQTDLPQPEVQPGKEPDPVKIPMPQKIGYVYPDGVKLLR